MRSASGHGGAPLRRVTSIFRHRLTYCRGIGPPIDTGAGRVASVLLSGAYTYTGFGSRRGASLAGVPGVVSSSIAAVWLGARAKRTRNETLLAKSIARDVVCEVIRTVPARSMPGIMSYDRIHDPLPGLDLTALELLEYIGRVTRGEFLGLYNTDRRVAAVNDAWGAIDGMYVEWQRRQRALAALPSDRMEVEHALQNLAAANEHNGIVSSAVLQMIDDNVRRLVLYV